MLKKRLIFTLLYDHGQFMLSRIFRLQKVGDLNWLQLHYNFAHISFSIDELVVLDVSRGAKNQASFCAALKQLTQGCFVPISAGGGIRRVEDARNLLGSGADKVVLNTALYESNGFIRELASEFGQQCVVASMDIKRAPDGTYHAWSECGSRRMEGGAASWIEKITEEDVGELYLNSMNRDGTGQGCDMQLLHLLPAHIGIPLILVGGVGNAAHLAVAFADPRVDAVATANLFNFVGDGLKQARLSLIADGVVLPVWDVPALDGGRPVPIP